MLFVQRKKEQTIKITDYTNYIDNISSACWLCELIIVKNVDPGWWLSSLICCQVASAPCEETQNVYKFWWKKLNLNRSSNSMRPPQPGEGEVSRVSMMVQQRGAWNRGGEREEDRRQGSQRNAVFIRNSLFSLAGYWEWRRLLRGW